MFGTTAESSVQSAPVTRSPGIFSAYSVLTKVRLNALVLMTTSVGFLLAPVEGIDWKAFFWTMLGTALAACSASAFNQMMEVNRDRRMPRTKNRPLPTGSLSMAHALVVAVVTGYAGVTILAVLVNFAAAALALATILIYTIFYTPMKVRSTLNTVVGAVCGALPPMIGWVAAGGPLNAASMVLPTILFVWQFPHFFALAWLYRTDYGTGGFKMLPVIDESGRITAQVCVVTSLMLIPLCLLATLLGVAGFFSAICATLLGLLMSGVAVQFMKNRTDRAARRLFLASISYLPILLAVLVIDRGPAAPMLLH
ncbi:MAG TPA: heme o synthase [Phycisphaerales bacterium]|nr:heme o synthase [Phycisphaerales bacterium]